MSRLFLGLDSSTQSLSGLVIDLDSASVVYEDSINFADDLPQYETRHGVLTDPDPRVAHAPPMMWVEALDMLFDKMKADGVALGDVLAVSGSGQQHGSVYLNASARETLRALDPAKSLVENLDGCLSRPTSPIWMDSSTTAECDEITQAMGSPTTVAEATGSIAFERFTGPQIRKFAKTDPEGYAATADIALVSSFLASILAGDIVPIDHGDGAGMNLMDIDKRTWHAGALEATAADLPEKLLPPVPSWTVTGTVCTYFSAKYGLNPEAKSVVWSGDNPNSLIGLGLVVPGDVAISLGTSDTFFGVMQECRVDPHGEGHVFVSPTGDYMTLICFKNGSLAREKIRDQFELDWPRFADATFTTPPGNEGKVLLPYFEPEITPKVLEPGVARFGLEKDDMAGNCRAVIEAQMMSMRLHSAWMNVKPTRILATGGASKDRAILRIMPDVHQCPVYRLEIANSAALGAALRAAHACLVLDGEVSWADLVAPFASPSDDTRVDPDQDTATAYDGFAERYAACEAAHVQG
jgi:xylulokinase